MSKFPKSEGVLFKNNDKQKDSHPDLRGHIVVTEEQIRKLVEMVKAGKESRLQAAAWRRKSKAGVPYMYLSTEAYMKDESEPRRNDPPQGDGTPDDDWEDDIPF